MNLPHSSEARAHARRAVVDGLARLRAMFPLEARLMAAAPDLRRHYARVLAHWLRGAAPPLSLLDAATLTTLQQLDAVVPGPEGLGCYPFSARPTGITVTLGARELPAMCAIDALAVARLAERSVAIQSTCAVCRTALDCRVEKDGALDHDQAGCAHVIWQEASHSAGSCSHSLCRHIVFLCPDCSPPAKAARYTLPQAGAIANSFFAFQRELLREFPLAHD